jgi:hypothetical protein
LDLQEGKAVDNNQLLVIGVICVAVAIVGGGLRISGIEIPLLSSIQRQVLLALLGFGLLSPAAYSTIKDYKVSHECQSYTKEAIQQFDENIEHSCRQKGERWHNAYERHYGWCLTQPKGNTQNESAARGKALANCKESGAT